MNTNKGEPTMNRPISREGTQVRSRQLAKLIAIVLAFSLFAAACGSDDPVASDNNDADTPAEDTSDDDTPAEDTSDDDTPAEDTSDDDTPAEDDTPADDTVDLPEVCDGQDGTGLKVGFANLGGGIPFTQQVEDGMKSVAADCNLELVIADNNFDGQTAVDNARNFVTQQVDGVIEFQVDASLSGAVCEELGDLPVIAIDIAHPECAVFMGADNPRAGEIGGEGLGAFAAENWDCQIDLLVSLENFGVGDVNIARANGLIRGIQTVCPDNDFGTFEDWTPEPGGIIQRCDCGGSTDSAFPLFRDILTANPDAEHIAVVSLNDDMGLAAVAAAEEAGRLEQIAVASQGADATIHDEIRENPQYVGSTAYFPESYGTYLVPAIIRMINGETVPDPILVEHLLIDKNTVDEYYPN